MNHHIVDFNYIYHYGIFNGLTGVEQAFIPRWVTKKRSVSKQSGYCHRNSISGTSQDELNLRFV